MDSPALHLAGAFRTEFAVSMTCQSCVDSITEVLHREGVLSVNIDLPTQRVVVESTAPPSSVMRLLRDTGRTVIVRGLSYVGGSGGRDVPVPGETIAAVAMMDHLHPDWVAAKAPGGLGRFVRASEKLTLLDLTVYDLVPGEHSVMLHALGDVQDVPRSCGEAERSLGTLHVGEDGRGDLVAEVPQALWELIGRSMVVGGRMGGVIARSSGAFENEKRVCACDGRTMWEEARLSSL